MKQKIGFVGLGLIGGSVAKALRQYFPENEVIAFDTNKESLASATQEGIIDVACSSVDDNFSRCDFIFLCTPVSCNSAYLPQLKKYMHPDCILTDVGSVKMPIHAEICTLDMEENFIGGHPMAGSEKTGYAHSKATLVENAYYVLTPSAKVSSEKTERLSSLIEALKAIPILLNAEEHDYITGAVSHLPHLLAAGLVNFVRENDSETELMKQLAAGGFKDMTRIASSSPMMWEQICVENSDNITAILEKYIVLLEQTKEFVKNRNSQALYELFSSAKDYRNSVPDVSAGPIQKAFAVYCDIADEAGGIAIIATILASSNINIKNIGILHNREFEEGVLKIEFYDETASQKAADRLRKHSYVVYER